ncbi:type II secretion system F family protein [Frankia sp. Mgl5]|uniref:type II secretion system F family protein n=1 Tax=Frankia sp. Mgl5 TaxID=2933793 RepID=UPI0025520DC7|nr:type II secretion system F family protein [Frankia sp. Mgl5]
MVNADAGVLLAVGCGTGCGIGLWLAGTGTAPFTAAARAWAGRRIGGLSRQARAARTLGAVAAAIVVGLLTGWPVAAALAALAVVILPGLLTSGRAEQAHTDRVEAIAVWTEMLRDTLAGAAGLEQAIRATAPITPSPIRAEVVQLATALDAGTRLPDALAEFADAVDDPTADLVVAALVMAATRQARHLADLLGRLAAAARDQTALRLRTAASRARIRTSTRVIATTTLAMAFGLVVLSPAFVEPYDSAAGQIMLLAVAALFAAGLTWLSRMGRTPTSGRILTRLPARSRP